MMISLGALRYTMAGLLVAMLAACSGLAVHAQGFSGAADIVEWTVEVQPQQIAAGDSARVVFEGQIDRGWKMYALDDTLSPSIPLQIAFDSLDSAFGPGIAFRQAGRKEGFDPNFNTDVRYFENRAYVEAFLPTKAGAAPGTYELGGTLRFMVCDAKQCLPPTRVPFAETVELGSGSGATGQATAPAKGDADVRSQPNFAIGTAPLQTEPSGGSARTPEGDAEAPPDVRGAQEQTPGEEEEAVAAAPNHLNAARSDGLWGFLLLAVGAGLAALLTPCVFPMIPLTVSYFTKHAHDRSEALRMAAVYGFAIVLIFTGLGVLMALLVGAAGAQSIAANPWVNLFIALVFIVFALSLLGLFELRLPTGLVNYFNRQGNERSGYTGVLFMGLTLTLVSFSCTAPFVGGLLAATAGGEWAYPVLGMLVFSATFAFPFVLFALFPKGLQSLPRSGAWMNAVKVVLGFVELAAALKFLSNADLVWGWGILSRPLAISISVVLFFLAGMYLLGKLPLAHEPDVRRIGTVRLLAAVAFFGLSLYLLPGLLGAPLGKLDAYLPPRQGNDVSLLAAFAARTSEGSTQTGEFDWHEDIEQAYAEAEREGKPVFIDFTGYTCTNCRDMEANVFPKPAVASRLRRDFVLLRLHTDDPERDQELQRYQLRLTGTVALPTYAVVHPESEELIVHHSGMASVADFAAFLEAGAALFSDGRLAAR